MTTETTSKTALTDIGVDDEAAKLIEEQRPDLASAEALKAFVAEENSIAKTIKGIGAKTEPNILAALEMWVPASPEPDQSDQSNLTDQTSVEDQTDQSNPSDQTDLPNESADASDLSNQTDQTDLKKEPEPEIEYVTIKLPVGPMPTTGYDAQQASGGRLTLGVRGRHLQLQLQPDEAMFYLRVREGMRITGQRLSDGRPAWETPDVTRVIAAKGLEQLKE